MLASSSRDQCDPTISNTQSVSGYLLWTQTIGEKYAAAMQSVQLLGPWMTADHLHLLKLTKTKKKTVEMMKMVDM